MDSVQKSSNADDWLLDIHRKLYQWSKNNAEGGAYRDLWNWVTDKRNLDLAWQRVATNKGRGTAGIDGVTVRSIRNRKGAEQAYLEDLRARLRSGVYHPKPVRRHWIPKPGKPGELRGLGIPTIEDRVVQAAILQIIEPLFEARFLHVSHGFRPGRAVRDAIEIIRRTAGTMCKDERRRKINPPYEWVIEGDIKGCFDNISHHAIMKRVRMTVADHKVTRLINAFLKAGIMEECKYIRTVKGTPQGGILSPLLANIALSAIEERYLRWVAPIRTRFGLVKNRIIAGFNFRKRDREKGKAVFYPVRYADDFVLIACGTRDEMESERLALANLLQTELGVELSEEKTKVTKLTDGFNFLGHYLRLKWNPRWGWVMQALTPLERQARLRRKIKSLTKRESTKLTLAALLSMLNPITRGWGNFYRHTNGAYWIFKRMDYYVYMRIFHWLRAKHNTNRWMFLVRRYLKPSRRTGWDVWTDGEIQCAKLLEIPRGRWELRKRVLPSYMTTVGEPGA